EAELIENAWLTALEDGYRTADIASGRDNEITVGTEAFARAVIDRLGRKPVNLPPAQAFELPPVGPSLEFASAASRALQASVTKELRGIDIFVDWDEADRDPNVLGLKVAAAGSEKLQLRMISNRGVKVFPEGNSATSCADHWRCRFTAESKISHADLLTLQWAIAKAGFDIIKTENLYWFDGKPGYSLGQGE
ncbi:MAG TPA: NADP-dependent isocitrate dehydrogenase, partial [Turneriella sp.]|nr:NADP-dependent isocitrate dehydrogenase [Turneriella sp.]